jgi:hypothetical protein
MTDIYKSLAASVLDKNSEEVSGEERQRAKRAFWTAFRAVAMLPGNEELRGVTVDVPPGAIPEL